MEKSKFETLNDDALIRYRNHVKKILSDNNKEFHDISDFYNFFTSTYRSENNSIVKSIVSPLRGNFSRHDIEYLYYIIFLSEVGEDRIERPKLVNKNIDYVSEERILTRITRSGKLSTYIPYSLDNSYLFDLRGSDNFEPYDWDETDREELDWDTRDDWFDL